MSGGPQGALLDQIHAAVAAHRAGRHDEARAAYEAILQRHPQEPQALLFLGMLLADEGRLAEGIALAMTAASLRPGEPLVFSNLAGLLNRAERREEALAAAETALRLRPGYVAAWLGKAQALRGLNRAAEAIGACEEGIGMVPDAMAVDLLTELGALLMAAGRRGEALGYLDRAVAVAPGHLPARLNRANCHLLMKETGPAIADYQAYLRAEPDNADALNGFAVALVRLGRPGEALVVANRAIELRPDWANAQRTRIMALTDLERIEEAAALSEDLAARYPADALVWKQCGALRLRMGDFAGSAAAYERSTALAPGDLEAVMYRGMQRLAVGRLGEGWRDFEVRLELLGGKLGGYRGEEPRWDGSAPLAGRHIAVTAEQGFGDTLQFCRFVAPLKSRGARVSLLVPPELVRLLRRLDGPDAVLGEVTPGFAADYQVSLMSLPAALGSDGIPAFPAGGYLRADPADVAAWGARLAGLKGLRVGLAWAGASRSFDRFLTRVDQRRSIDPELLAPLGEIGGVSFVSLQRQASRKPPFEMADWTGELHDFADTAALVAGLDAVISVDTAILHLAGGLGVPTLLLNRFDSCWRWLPGLPAGRPATTPWYPGMRILHQPQPGDWAPVVRACAGYLREWTQADHGPAASVGELDR